MIAFGNRLIPGGISMIANYHTHTPRCNHAVGSEVEYVENALAQGLKILGFSTR